MLEGAVMAMTGAEAPAVAGDRDAAPEPGTADGRSPEAARASAATVARPRDGTTHTTRLAALFRRRQRADPVVVAIERMRALGVRLSIVIDVTESGPDEPAIEVIASADDVWWLTAHASAGDGAWLRMGSRLAQSAAVDWLLVSDPEDVWLLRPDVPAMLGRIRTADLLGVAACRPVDPIEPPAGFVDPGTMQAVWLEPLRPVPGPAVGRDRGGAPAGAAPVVVGRPSAIAGLTADGGDEALPRFRTERGWASGVVVVRPPLAAAAPATGRGKPRTVPLRSAADLLAPVAPRVGSMDEHVAAVKDGCPFLEMLSAVCRLEGVVPAGMPQPVSSYQDPTYIVPPDHVVKIYGPWEDSPAGYDRELAAYGLLARDPTLPVPRLLGHGTIDEAHRYLLLERLHGDSLLAVREEVEPAAILEAARWAGAFLQRLHAIPLSAEDREAGLEAFRDLMRELRRTAVADGTGLLGLPAHLAEQLDGWLPSLEELTGDGSDLVVVHGDFKYKHILVERRPSGGHRPIGVIDMNRVRIGRPVFDLCYVWSDVAEESTEVIAAFLGAAAIPMPAPPAQARWALAWALVQRWRRAYLVPGAEAAATLDELASIAFGPALP